MYKHIAVARDEFGQYNMWTCGPGLPSFTTELGQPLAVASPMGGHPALPRPCLWTA